MREILLAASAQAVLASFRDALDRCMLTHHQAASLRVLESALVPYREDGSPLTPNDLREIAASCAAAPPID